MGLLLIVHLEANDADAELVRAELQTGGIGCEVLRVRNESELIREVARQPIDIILSDRHGALSDGLRASHDRAGADAGGAGYFCLRCG